MKYLLAFILIGSTLLASPVKHRPFIVVTPQKTGTHLLTKALTLILKQDCVNEWQGDIPNELFREKLNFAKKQKAYLHMHARPKEHLIATLKEKGYRVIFLMRDPRDQAISMLYYVLKGWNYGPISASKAWGNLSFEDKLHEIITGERYGISGTQGIVGTRIPWMYQDSDFVLTVRFENLVGEQGGGSRLAQVQELQKIMRFINADITESKMLERSLNLFGKPGESTFRKGQINQWKEVYTPRLTDAMKKVFGNQLIYLGYESDLNW